MKKIVIAKTYMLTEEADKAVAEVMEDCDCSSAEAIFNMYNDALFVGEGLIESQDPDDTDIVITVYEGWAYEKV